MNVNQLKPLALQWDKPLERLELPSVATPFSTAAQLLGADLRPMNRAGGGWNSQANLLGNLEMGKKLEKIAIFFIKVSWIPVGELGIGKIFRKPQSGKSIWTCLGDLCYLDVWWTVQTNSFLQNCVSHCEDGGNPDEPCWKTAFFDASQMEIFFLRNSLWARRCHATERRLMEVRILSATNDNYWQRSNPQFQPPHIA